MGTHRQQLTRLNPEAKLPARQDVSAHKQDTRLLIALSLLLVALIVVLVKDREFWFGWDEGSQSAAVTPATPEKTGTVARTSSVPVARPATETVKKTATKAPATVASQQVPAKPEAPIVASNRVVLPPLDVEVVAGDSHKVVRPGSNATKVEIPSEAGRNSGVATTVTSASMHERLRATPELQQTIESYPLLTPHSRVQGSVVLQAVVGADGSIEDLRVVSGPSILVAAAQQAVRQWHFKPYLENGQPVETKARITVNFSIKISDDSKAS